MKVLIACNRDSYKNPYVRTLADGLIEQGIDVTCSISEFWNNAISYDIIHIMWPNLLVKSGDENCTELQSIIEMINQAGKALICTCHNIKPHYNDGIAINNTYKIIYESCTYIHHMGESSIRLLQEAYPNIKAKSIVIPHHTYDRLYNFCIDKKLARLKLNIPLNMRVVLSFGVFRDDEERKIVIELADKMRNYYFLMPGFYRAKIVRKNIIKGLVALKNTIKYFLVAKKHHLHIRKSFVPDELLPYYLAAADVLLIQRINILNSGNVPLAMLSGLPIIGPNVGNVKEVLLETNNYVFDTDNLNGINDLIKNAIDCQNIIGESNIKYAKEKLSTSIVSKKFVELYKMISL